MRLSNYMTALQKLLVLVFLALALPFGARGQVGITIVTTPTNPHPGDAVTADFLVHNFQNILSMQFSLQWSSNSLTYSSIYNYDLIGLGSANFSTTQASTGKIAISWLNPNFDGVTVADCDRIFSISYTAVTSDVPDIVITGNPTSIEVVDGNGSVVALEQNNMCGGAGAIIGNIFHDLNNDCQPTLGEPKLKDWKVKIERNGTVFYRSANSSGDYTFYGLPGDYNVSLVLPQNNLWTTCQPVQTVAMVGGENHCRLPSPIPR